MQNLLRRLGASRFFTFSLLFHVILVVLGGSVVLFHSRVDPPDFPPDTIIIKNVSVEEDQETPINLPQEGALPPGTPFLRAEILSGITSNYRAFVRPPILPEITAPNGRKLPGTIKPPQALPTAVPERMRERMGGEARATAAMKTGGKEKSERAVMAGLRWLKMHQNAEGSWSDEYKPSMTGLALLCFLGHGELPESPEFGPTVKRALDWILEKGNEFGGRMSLTKEGWGGGTHSVYEHAILTYAMAEYFSLSKDERFAELLKQAVGYIVEGQTPMGGWDYGYRKGVRNDLSVAGWQIQALHAAHLTGLGIAGVDEALDKSMVFLKKWQGNEGGFGYDRPDNRVSLTGVGVFCMHLWKPDEDKVLKAGINFLLGKADVKYKSDKTNLYAWYYDTQACFVFKGAWSKWNRLFQDEISKSQSPDGSWPPIRAQGHSALEAKPDGAGPIYRTALCVLMLEVFYRNMPIEK